MKFVAYGAYASTRCKRAGFPEQAGQARSAGEETRAAGRREEDLAIEEMNARADRDVCDEAVDARAEAIEYELRIRGPEATSQAPYTTVFSQGITWYTRAPLPEQVSRYQSLAQRCRAALPPEDKVVGELVPLLEKDLDTWRAAAEALTSAEVARSLAAEEVAASKTRFNQVMDQIYGHILGVRGKKVAERMFQKL